MLNSIIYYSNHKVAIWWNKCQFLLWSKSKIIAFCHEFREMRPFTSKPSLIDKKIPTLPRAIENGGVLLRFVWFRDPPATWMKMLPPSSLTVSWAVDNVHGHFIWAVIMRVLRKIITALRRLRSANFKSLSLQCFLFCPVAEYIRFTKVPSREPTTPQRRTA